MTDLDITAIRERAEKATRGPWFATREGQVHRHVPGGRKGWWEPEHEDIGGGNFGGEGGGYYMEEADAKFIAHAREDIPALLAALESSRAVVERLQGELDAQTVEWGTKHPHNGSVIPAKDEHEAVRDARIFPGFEAVFRKVGPWLPVPTDGAESVECAHANGTRIKGVRERNLVCNDCDQIIGRATDGAEN